MKFVVKIDEEETPNQVLVGSFSEGRPERIGDVGGVPDMQVEVFEHSGGKRKLVIAYDDTMEWQATNFGPNAAKKNMSDYAIGIFDKNTRELKLVKLDTIYQMTPHVKGTKSHTEDEQAAPEGLNNLERRNQLIEAFGASRAKRIVNSQKANIVAVESISNADHIREEMKAQAQQNIDILHQQVIRNVPPFDETATTAAGCYPLDRVIPAYVWKDLNCKELIEASKNAGIIDSWRKSHFYPDYVLEKLALVKSAQGKEQKKLRGKLVLFISYLLHIKSTKMRRVRSKPDFRESMSWLPESSVDFICETFYVMQGPDNEYFMDDRHQDLLIQYIFVLSLHLESFSFPFKLLQTDLGLTTAQARSYLMELGCEITQTKESEEEGSISESVVNLKPPLKFPTLRTRKSRN